MEFLKAYLDFTVFGILSLMAFIVVWLTIERLLFFKALVMADFEHPTHLNIAMTNNLTIISTIGANAPYIGLLGTVLGILVTFFEIGQQSTIDTGVIMTSLALALKATAAGIALAIPSIMIYNGFMRKVEVIDSQFKAHQEMQNKP